jgi:superfamily II DNA/RNA helicase
LEQIEGSSGDTIMMRCAVCSKIIADERDNIKEKVRQKKLQMLIKLLTDTNPKGLRQRWERPVKHYQRGIIYCRTRKETAELLENIQVQIPELAPHITVFHGKLSAEERTHVYQRFIADDDNAIRLIIATNAFGMGVDVARLGFVIHFDVPSSPEAYYQEAGRAGRNFSAGESAQCILLYHESDLDGQRWLMQQNAINEQEIISTSLALCHLYQRRSQSQELLVADTEIALHANVDKDKVDTLLYYLEHHASLKGKPVIERKDDAQHVKYLRWHRSHRRDTSLPPLAQYMVRLFQGDTRIQKFQLDETNFTLIDVNELTQELQESDNFTDIAVSKVNEMLYLLVGQGILTYLKKGLIQCRGTLNEVTQQLEIHKEAIKRFLLQADADNSQKLRAGKYIQISLERCTQVLSYVTELTTRNGARSIFR